MKAICHCDQCSGTLAQKAGRRLREAELRLRRRFLEDLRGWRRGNQDEWILAAHSLLVEAEAPPELIPDPRRVRVTSLAKERCFGCVDRQKNIWIDLSSVFYQRAKEGDLLPLASLLLHEAYHVQHGPDEPGAYAQQLNFVKRAGADDALITFVEHAARRHV